MYIGGFVHRDKLFEIATRWLRDELHSDDAWNLTEIFAYEGFISALPVKHFFVDFLEELYNSRISIKNVSFKHQVKEEVIRGIKEYDNRLDYLVRQYKARPEEYFPRAPITGQLFFTEGDDLVGMFRVKRARRVAEKVSRRIADHILKHIKQKAEDLAHERAQRLGIPLAMLMTPPEQMVKEFESAERQLAQAFTHGEISFNKEDIAIHDVIGMKIIGNADMLQRAEYLLRTHPDITWVEREEHHGEYNAVNIQVDMKMPEENYTLERLFSRITPPFPAKRGISIDDLIEGFPAYLHSGRRNIRIELILTNYNELVESEIGRSIHEERTLRQRKERAYTGRIAKNAEFIIEYLLSVAFSPKTNINFLPVKLRGHYLPETISYAVRKLYDIEESAIFPRFSI